MPKANDPVPHLFHFNKVNNTRKCYNSSLKYKNLVPHQTMTGFIPSARDLTTDIHVLLSHRIFEAVKVQ